MLKYKVKPGKDIELRSFPISNFYVSSDLLNISGMTDYNIGLVNGERVLIRSPYLIGNELNSLNVEYVTLQGRVGISITLPVETITRRIKLYMSSDADGCFYYENNKKIYVENDECSEYIFKDVEQKYVKYKGDISYFFNGDSENESGYLVNHKFYQASYNDKAINIKTYVLIEDGKMIIGDYTYSAYFTDNDDKPSLKLNKYREPLKANDEIIGYIDGNPCTVIAENDNSILIKDYKREDWKKVCKFNITKNPNPTINPEDVMYGGYNHYITYGDENIFLNDIYKDDTYLGYGVLVNDNFYPITNGYESDRLFGLHKDVETVGAVVYLAETDETLNVNDGLISPVGGGSFILLIDSADNNDIIVGNYIMAKSNHQVKIIRYVEEGIDGDEQFLYITYNGVRYDIKEHLYDTIDLSGKRCMLEYLDDEYTKAKTEIDGVAFYFNIDKENGVAILDNEIYYKDLDNCTDDKVFVKYGINEEGYEITYNSGVTVNKNTYMVNESILILDTVEEEAGVQYYVELLENVEYPFLIREIDGLSTYVCYPVINDSLVDDLEIDGLSREICNIVVENWKDFTFTLRKDTFGNKVFSPENGLVESMSSKKPYATSDAFLLENKIEILRIYNYVSFKFPLMNNSANNLFREDVINNYFVNDISKGSINQIVDMEKDVYYPVWKDEDTFRPIEELRFNLHFRTRNLDNLNIIEDNREYINNRTVDFEMSNWFITDYGYYREKLDANRNTANCLQHSSDLLGLIGFTDDDIRYGAKRLSKSFLRLSFYSSNDPQTNVLLATSTIFFDENAAYKKYLDSHRNSDIVYVDVDLMQRAGYNTVADYQTDVENSADTFQVSSRTISNTSEAFDDDFFNDGIRLSSRFSVFDKNITDTSSEGYYLYMFKEYTKKMHESTVYLRVEFNHAGIGRTIPFMLPRRFGVNDNVGTILRLSEQNDLGILRNGFNLRDIYSQMYIPIRVIYDENRNQYVYYLPDELRDNEMFGIENEIMEFNLFEVKFANESIVTNYNEDNTY